MAMKKSTKGMGFKAAMQNVEAKEGVSKAAAGRIIGAAKAKAMKNPAAVRRNPNLMNTSGGKKMTDKQKDDNFVKTMKARSK